jgi:hypothetical protein
VSVLAGHRPRACALVRSGPHRLRYFPAVPASLPGQAPNERLTSQNLQELYRSALQGDQHPIAPDECRKAPEVAPGSAAPTWGSGGFRTPGGFADRRGDLGPVSDGACDRRRVAVLRRRRFRGLTGGSRAAPGLRAQQRLTSAGQSRTAECNQPPGTERAAYQGEPPRIRWRLRCLRFRNNCSAALAYFPGVLVF